MLAHGVGLEQRFIPVDIREGDRVQAVLTHDGQRFDCDMMVNAAGECENLATRGAAWNEEEGFAKAIDMILKENEAS